MGFCLFGKQLAGYPSHVGFMSRIVRTLLDSCQFLGMHDAHMLDQGVNPCGED